MYIFYIMGDNSFAGISFGYDNNKVFDYREKNICKKWEDCYKNFEPMNIKLMKNEEGLYIVSGKIQGSLSKYIPQKNVLLKYWASNSPTFSSSFSGSGLPYPNEKIAFENSDNVGTVSLNNGSFLIKINYPNSYYSKLGTQFISPEIKLRLIDTNGKALSEIYKINLGDGIPYRSLTWNHKRNWNNGPLFYKNNKLPIRTQEQILRDSAYPKTNQEYSNFWGLKPSH